MTTKNITSALTFVLRVVFTAIEVNAVAALKVIKNKKLLADNQLTQPFYGYSPIIKGFNFAGFIALNSL